MYIVIQILFLFHESQLREKRRNIAGVSDLSGSLKLDEVFVDLLGLGGHLHWVLGLLKVLTGHPELNVLFTELRLQEATESSQTIYEKKWQEVR